MFVNFGASLAATNPAWGLQVMYNTAPPGYGASTFAYSSAYLLGPQPGLSIGANQSWGAWAKIPGRWGGPTYGMCQSLNAGAAGVGRLAGGWGILDNPFALRLFFDQGDLAYRQYLEGQRAMREAGRPPETEGGKAPDNPAQRAGDYYDEVVGRGGAADKAAEALYGRKGAAGLADSKADTAMRGLTEMIAGWLNPSSRASAVRRTRLVDRAGKWEAAGVDPTTEDMLIALLAPGAEKKADIPKSSFEGLLTKEYLPAEGEQTPERLFDAYVEMLQAYLGDDYDSVIADFYGRTLDIAGNSVNVPLEDIEASGAASGPAADPAAGLDPALRALLESAAGADAGAGADSDTGAETGEGE